MYYVITFAVGTAFGITLMVVFGLRIRKEVARELKDIKTGIDGIKDLGKEIL